MIVVVDFGSQTAHLIARRIKELGIHSDLVLPEQAIETIKKEKPAGIIFSGGPSSVYGKNAPTIDPAIFSFGIPILGICYGLQLTAKLLSGEVVSGKKEYGPATVKISNFKFQISNGLPEEFIVWMSHGDEVVSMPKEFVILGSSKHVQYAFVANEDKKIYGIQFHPEVEHTEHGGVLLKNFVEICKEKVSHHVIDIQAIEKKIQEKVGERAYVIGAVSGGVDSTVAGVLTAKAIGKRFIPIYVDNGLMREGTEERVKNIFHKTSSVKPIVVREERELLRQLHGIKDPEKKRRIIGKHYIDVFEKQMQKLVSSGKPVKFLLQGTIYSDVIESQGSKHASKIKSHHNVGGLPKKMKLTLLEPLREFYKDEVREIGRRLGIPEEFIRQQPFPGPGYAIRIRGEVTKDRLKKIRMADRIVLEELEKAGILFDIFQSFPVMTGAYSTAVKGDEKFFGEVVCLRVIETKDIMTAVWSRLPYDLLQKISSRIVNEVPGISRVVYDITTKPPATMEWE
ncbi:MAG: glutamine-hydrolyzing GMP synthase [Candidatus Levybacteria bacterium]|nr:glutamine-hydrolyzing GMP synthase [Candidatus Levybacteria bacterium]